jgi:hypothetical protein
MKKTYISPVIVVDEAEMADGLLATMSIQVSDNPGNEEYVKEENTEGGDWDIDW